MLSELLQDPIDEPQATPDFRIQPAPNQSPKDSATTVYGTKDHEQRMNDKMRRVCLFLEQ
jgi:hypothetical protein